MADQAPDDRITRAQPRGSQDAIRANAPEPSQALHLASSGSEIDGISHPAQSARVKQINSARTTLIVIGGLTIAFNIVLAFLAPGELDAELRKQGWDPNNLLPEQQTIVRITLMIHYAVLGGFAVMGAAFVGLGMMVRRYPVPCTIAGLGLYVLGGLIQLVLDPASLALGWIIKLVILIALFKAVHAALAAEREKRQALAGIDDAY